MNLDRSGAVGLARGVAERARQIKGADLVVCPPAVYLEAVGQALAGSPVGLGAQNMYCERAGAFTGEISAAMLVDLGCRYVILGHSERRQLLGESSNLVSRKARAALAAGLTPIICVGELLEEREAGRTRQVIQQQFTGSLAGMDGAQASQIVLAYEPVWAIGTGRVATGAQAEEVHRDLRNLLEERYNADVAASVRIQYGGSVKTENAAELLAQPNIDGALVGGASLKADDFLAIAAAAA
jgi:triosephosphate isomerase